MKKIYIYYVHFLFICILISPNYGQTGILGNNIYTPILVTSPHMSASGFYLMQGGNVYFITARHVVVNSKGTLTTPTLTLTSYSPGKDGPEKNVLEIDLIKADSIREVRIHKYHDVAILRVGIDTIILGKRNILFMDYVHSKDIAKQGLIAGSALTLFDSAILSNDAFILGYPGAIGIPDIPQLDYSQPLIRKGVIAGKNLRNKTLIIDCPTYPGNSGGPVFEVDQKGLDRTMRIVGVVSEFIPFEETWRNARFGYENHQISNSGYCVVEPMDFVLELFK